MKLKDFINKEINKYVLEKFAIPSEGKKGFCWENEDLSYPKTCALLKKQMKSFLPTIQKFKLIDPLPLYDTIKEKNLTSFHCFNVFCFISIKKNRRE